MNYSSLATCVGHLRGKNRPYKNFSPPPLPLYLSSVPDERADVVRGEKEDASSNKINKRTRDNDSAGIYTTLVRQRRTFNNGNSSSICIISVNFSRSV